MSNIGYIALYRKYRPQSFSEMIGQEHITVTLKNQVSNNRTAHAYLFSGPRGTGKTSVARILARAVNCLHNVEGDPCNECEICKGIADGSIMDIIEIDAASNNSVDNIRNIRDEVVYTPSKSKYKVYIIDEVHMLSTGAFNALLKTLEEPPEHVIFILATTEPHKLLPTIISRCQKFDFKRFSSSDVLKRLQEITKKIDAKIEQKALELISQVCDGGMRDALSILDQSISLGKECVTHKDILELIGQVDNESLLNLSDAIKNKDTTTAIRIINEAFYEGKDLNHFIVKLINHYRNLLMIKSLNNVNDIVELSEEEIDKIRKGIDKYSINELTSIMSEISNTLTESKRTGSSKILLEASIIKLCNSETTEDLTERVKKLESILKEGKPVEIKEQKEEKKSLRELAKREKEIQIKEENDVIQYNDLSREVTNKWGQILENMKGKGYTPLKIQYFNDMVIKPFNDNGVLGYVEYKQDIFAKILEDKKLIEELKNSISCVIGREIGFKVQSRKVIEQACSEIDKFKELLEQNGMQNLINEM